MRWLRPTWLAAAVLVLPLALLGLFLLVRWDEATFALAMLMIQLPFELYRALGLPVGRRGDWFGFAFPNGPGWALILATDAAVLYVLGCAASAGWRRLHRASAPAQVCR